MIRPRAYLGLFLLSAATLAFEINLTRLFSVAQFYHFAFMIVSLALLGFGASGTALAVNPGWGHVPPSSSLSGMSLACAVSILGAYLLANWLPFDSFSLAWDRRQAAVLALHYAASAAPFFFGGMAVGILLTASPQTASQTYAVSLLGAAMGCVVALVAPSRLGGEGTAVLSSGLSALGALVTYPARGKAADGRKAPLWRLPGWLLIAGLLAFWFLDSGLRLSGQPALPLLQLRLSPYKSLAYALQYPGAEVIYQKWNAFSRVDVVRSPGVRSLPGLSYRYSQPPPPQHGLLVDGDDLSPIVLPNSDPTFADYLPTAIAFHLRPNAEALILEPRGGLDVATALALGARRVTAVEMNPLIVEAARHLYADPRVRVIVESDRSYLRRAEAQYDVIVLSLATTYHPVRSGAYSLAEDYRYTVEAFQDALARLNDDGVFVVTRWLQVPPSEELRAFALALTALERMGRDPAQRLAAFRGYTTATLLVKKDPFTPDELANVREFAASRAFDLIYAPDIQPEEVNQYNVLPEPVYYQAFTGLLRASSRAAWYAAYPFEVAPPTDDRPFFGHFFKWSQAGQVMAELGKTWQPFGGAGYFVLLALLSLALVMAGVLILLPVAVARVSRRPDGPLAARQVLAVLIYFGLIGLGFLLIEIPLIQRFILFLGHPAYALTAVLFTLLLFSGLGSQLSPHVAHTWALVALVVGVLSIPRLLPAVFHLALGFPLALRLGVTAIVLAPLGFLMGIPFPTGVRWMTGTDDYARLIPWAWAVNGAASVISAVLAALLALSFGFSVVLLVGALCYAGAWLTALVQQRAGGPSPRR